MSMGEGGSDELRGDSRANDIGPIGLNDYLPGAPSDYHPSAMPYDMGELRQNVSNVADAASNVQSILQNRANDLAKLVTEPAHQISARLYGKTANALDTIGNGINKLQSKLDGKAVGKMTSILARMEDLGIPTPTPQQIAYGNSTGDYIGSLAMENQQLTNPQINQPPVPIIQPVQGGVINPPIIGGEETLPTGIGGGGGGGVGGGTFVCDPNAPIVAPKNCSVVLVDRATGKVAPPSCCVPGKMFWQAWGFDTEKQCQDYVCSIGGDSTYCSAPCEGQPPGGGGGGGQNCDVCPPGMYQWRDDKTGNCFYTLNGVAGSIKGATLVKKCPDIPPPPPTVPGGTGGDKCCPPAQTIINVPPCPTGGGDGGSGPPKANDICVTDGPKICKVPDPFRTPKLSVDSDTVCDKFAEYAKNTSGDGHLIGKFIQAAIPQTDDSTIGGYIKKAITGSNQPILAFIINTFGQWLDGSQHEILKNTPCDSLSELGWASVNGLAKLIDKWFGIVPQAMLNTLQQIENYVCQHKIPDQPSVDKAFLANEIDRATWECLTKANGNYLELAGKGPDTLRSRPTPEQYSKLFRQKQITLQQFQNGLRGDGVIRDEDAKAIFDLTQDWPTLSVLIPWLVRDVFDEKNIDWTQADKLFEDKYTDQTKFYSDAIGVPKEVFKLQWRAHFKLPSWTMAIDMFHRFRNLAPNHPLFMSQEKLRQLLIQDDWEPQWVDRIIATSYSLLRLVDIRRAYEIRSLTDEELKEQLRKRGLNDDDTETMAAYWSKMRDLRDNVKAGMPTAKQLVRSYANCELDEDTFRDTLAQVVESEEQETKALNAAKIAKKISDRKELIKSLEWKCKMGFIDQSGIQQALADAGVSPACQTDIAGRIQQKCSKKPKELAAGQICTMLERAIISPAQAFESFMAIGYDSDRATLMLKNCQVGIGIKQRKAAEAEARRIQAEQRRLAKELDKQRRLEECGPPPCPKRPTATTPKQGGGQKTSGQTTTDTVANASTSPASPDNQAGTVAAPPA